MNNINLLYFIIFLQLFVVPPIIPTIYAHLYIITHIYLHYLFLDNKKYNMRSKYYHNFTTIFHPSNMILNFFLHHSHIGIYILFYLNV